MNVTARKRGNAGKKLGVWFSKPVLVLLLVCCGLPLRAQRLDSILLALQKDKNVFDDKNPLVTLLLQVNADTLQLHYQRAVPADYKLNIAWALFNKYRRSDSGKALEMAMAEQRFSKQLKYEIREANAFRHIGIAYHGIGQRSKAVEFFLKATQIYERKKLRFQQAACLNNIGLIYMDIRQYAKAAKYFNRALAIWKNIPGEGEEGLSIVLDNLGSLYAAQGNDSIALGYLKQAIAVAKKIDNRSTLCESMEGIGTIYLKQNNLPLALSYLSDGLKEAIAIENKNAESNIYRSLSKISALRGQLDDALRLARKGLETATLYRNKMAIANSYHNLAEVYGLRKDYATAYLFEHRYVLLHDSINSQSISNEIEKLNYDYELEKKELQNQALLKDKGLKETTLALREAVINRQRTFAVLTSIVLVLCLLFAGFFFYSYRKEKAYARILGFQNREAAMRNQDIALQNEEIVAQNEEIVAQNEELYSQHKELSRQKENLAKINIAQNKVFTIISHDLRGPFSSIEGVTTLFQQNLIGIEEMKKLTQKLSERTKLTIDLLDNLLHWSRSQMQGVEVIAKNFNISKVIGDTVKLLTASAQAKNIGIEMHVQDAIVYADATMIATVIRNLVSNAIKFCYPECTITISTAAKNGLVCVYIKDTGIGMEKVALEKLFDTTVYYSSIGTGQEKGTGLGLNLCYEFVKLNGGTIHVESELGHGSVFSFTIPEGK